MNTKELKITPPKGYEIDVANSTFEHIKFKPIKKKLTYDDIAKELFSNKKSFVANSSLDCYPYGVSYVNEPNVCTSKEQGKKLLAINQLMNVAKYLNGDWKPNWANPNEGKYYLKLEYAKKITVERMFSSACGDIYFKSLEFAEQAKEILGEDTIRLALSTDW